jgi:diaminopimelate decarboxylase
VGTGVAYASKAFPVPGDGPPGLRGGHGHRRVHGRRTARRLAAGVPGGRLVLHGNNKSDAELAAPWTSGWAGSWSTPSTRSTGSTGWLSARPAGPKVLVRVTPGIEAHTHEYVMTGQDDSKFGFGLASGAAAEAVARLRQAGTPVESGRSPRPHRVSDLRP